MKLSGGGGGARAALVKEVAELSTAVWTVVYTDESAKRARLDAGRTWCVVWAGLIQNAKAFVEGSCRGCYMRRSNDCRRKRWRWCWIPNVVAVWLSLGWGLQMIMDWGLPPRQIQT